MVFSLWHIKKTGAAMHKMCTFYTFQHPLYLSGEVIKQLHES